MNVMSDEMLRDFLSGGSYKDEHFPAPENFLLKTRMFMGDLLPRHLAPPTAITPRKGTTSTIILRWGGQGGQALVPSFNPGVLVVLWQNK